MAADGVPALPRVPAVMPDLPGMPVPRTDLPPAEQSLLPKTTGQIEDRAASPPPPTQSHRLTLAEEVATLYRLSQGAVNRGRSHLVGPGHCVRQRSQPAGGGDPCLLEADASGRRISHLFRRRVAAQSTPGQGDAATTLLTCQVAAKASLRRPGSPVEGAQYDLAAVAQLFLPRPPLRWWPTCLTPAPIALCSNRSLPARRPRQPPGFWTVR